MSRTLVSKSAKQKSSQSKSVINTPDGEFKRGFAVKKKRRKSVK